MELKVVWTEFAKLELKKIFAYHKKYVSIKVAKNLVKNITVETTYLPKYIRMGQKELLLESRKEGFRYLVCGNYKIIYGSHLKYGE